MRSSTYGTTVDGGIGGGGAGSNIAASNGVANTGGGGGGGGWQGNTFHAAGAGGSGIVIVRYIDPTLPLSVTASVAASEVGVTSATLRGRIGGIGGVEDPDVYLCWGTVDPETSNTGDWARVESIGNEWSAGDAFSAEMTGLIPNQTYFCRAYVTNSSGDAWSETIEFRKRAIYVATNATPADPWATWATAFTNLQEALNAAAINDAILMAGSQTFKGGPLGAAYPSNSVFLMRNLTNVTLRGGYEADPLLASGNHPGPHDPVQWPTLLERASGTARVLTMTRLSNVLIEQVTIRNGSLSATYGAGVYVDNCRELTLAQCTITNNLTTGGGGDQRGGGIYAIASELMLTNCLVTKNTSTGFGNGSGLGGGIFMESGHIDGSRFAYHAKPSQGSGKPCSQSAWRRALSDQRNNQYDHADGNRAE